jgi:hypothetical protein
LELAGRRVAARQLRVRFWQRGAGPPIFRPAEKAFDLVSRARVAGLTAAGTTALPGGPASLKQSGGSLHFGVVATLRDSDFFMLRRKRNLTYYLPGPSSAFGYKGLPQLDYR